MDATIAAILLQDGITTGAIYALMALVTVLVFTVTRVILVPAGEFVAFGALTLATLQRGGVPGTVNLLVAAALIAGAIEVASAARRGQFAGLPRALAGLVAVPLLIAAVVAWAAPRQWPLAAQGLLALAAVTPLGPLLYRIAYQPIAEATVLVLLIVSVGVHFVLMGLGLYFFGAEGWRTPAFVQGSIGTDAVTISGQSLVVVAVSALLMLALAVFFSRTLRGKALRATAVNRVGARLMGISTTYAGMLAFGLAAFVGALSGVLVAPIATVYYDSGFLIGLKGFVGAILGGLVSYPLATVGALAVGVLESFSSFWASDYKEIIVFTLVLPALLYRSLRHPHREEEEA